MNKIKAVIITTFITSIVAMLSVTNQDSDLFWALGSLLFLSACSIILMLRNHLISVYAHDEEKGVCEVASEQAF